MHSTLARILVVSIVLAAGGILLLVKSSNAREQASAPAPVIHDPDRDVLALKQQMAAMRHEMKALGQDQERLLTQASAEPDQSAPAASEPEQPAELSAEEGREAALQAHSKAVEYLDGRMQRDASDPQWTSRMQQEVAAALPVDSRSSLRAVSCHTQLCRVDLMHEDRQALERFKEVLHALPYDMDILYEPDGESFHSVMFVSHHVQQMPDWRREMMAESNP